MNKIEFIFLHSSRISWFLLWFAGAVVFEDRVWGTSLATASLLTLFVSLFVLGKEIHELPKDL